MPISTTGISRQRVGVPIIDSDTLTALETGAAAALGCVWLEILAFDEITPSELRLIRQFESRSRNRDRMGRVIAVDERIGREWDIRVGDVAKYLRYCEFQPTGAEAKREYDTINAEVSRLQRLLREFGDKLDADEKEYAEGRMAYLLARRPPAQTFKGVNYQSADGTRQFIALPRQCISLVIREESK